MSIFDLMQQMEIQGAFCIKAWNDIKNDYIIIYEGHDFEIESRKLHFATLDAKIKYMYAVDGILNFELDL